MRRAIALIELIFAIVVIAITLLAVSNLINTTTKASSSAITQEAISNGASQASMVMSQYWDESSSKSIYGNAILQVESTDSKLKEATDSSGNLLGRRAGSSKESFRRYGIDSSGNKLKASTIGTDSDDTLKDDIDDFNNQSYTLVTHTGESTTAAEGDYKDTKVKITTKVNYISDSANYSANTVTFNNPFATKSAKSTNIKAVEVTISSDNDKNKKIVLKAFSCNIGTGKLKERKF